MVSRVSALGSVEGLVQGAPHRPPASLCHRQILKCVQYDLTGSLAPLAGVRADLTGRIIVVPTALLCTHPTDVHACRDLAPLNGWGWAGKASKNASSHLADVRAIQTGANAARDVQVGILAETGVGAGSACLCAFIAHLDAFHQCVFVNRCRGGVCSQQFSRLHETGGGCGGSRGYRDLKPCRSYEARRWSAVAVGWITAL